MIITFDEVMVSIVLLAVMLLGWASRPHVATYNTTIQIGLGERPRSTATPCMSAHNPWTMPFCALYSPPWCLSTTPTLVPPEDIGPLQGQDEEVMGACMWWILNPDMFPVNGSDGEASATAHQIPWPTQVCQVTSSHHPHKP